VFLILFFVLSFLFYTGRALVLTTLHTPENAAEYLRVENEGGIIEENRLYHPSWNGALVNLGLTRSIGDLFFKDERYTGKRASGLTAEPSVGKVLLRLSDEFVIVASDGFWHVVTPDAAIGIVHNLLKQRKDLNFVCRQLTEMAIIRGSRDNVTVLLVMFQTAEQMQQRQMQQKEKKEIGQKETMQTLSFTQTQSQVHFGTEREQKRHKQ
jgi:serine/threonine protein phosphatase PrpC